MIITDVYSAVDSTVLAMFRHAMEDDTLLPADNFYDMGGDSVLALHLIGELERTYGVRIPAPEFFDAPSIAAIAGTVTSLLQAAPHPAGNSIPRESADVRTRASMAQEWALLSALDDPGAPILQFHVVYRLVGSVDDDALHRALARVTERHPCLRTRFHVDGGRVYQMVADETPISLERIDACGQTGHHAQELLHRLVREPFDRFTGPLWRAVLLSTGAEHHFLAFVFDHMIADGWSVDVLVRDFSAVYQGKEPPVLSAAGPYTQWSGEQWRRWESGHCRRVVGYWTEVLPEMPADFSLRLPGYRGGGPLEAPASLSEMLPDRVADALAASARSLRTTPYCASMAALNAVIAERTERSRVTLLTTNANRLDGAYQQTIGWFATGVFPTTVVDLRASFRELVSATHRQILTATTHGDMPAMYVRRRVWPNLPPGFRKEPGVYFMYNDEWGADLDLGPDLTVSGHHLPEDADSPGLHLWLTRERSGLRLLALHHGSEYAPATVREFTNAFVRALVGLCEAPDTPMKQVLTAVERRRR